MAGEEFLLKRDAMCQHSFRGGAFGLFDRRMALGLPSWPSTLETALGCPGRQQLRRPGTDKVAAVSALYLPDVMAVTSQFTEKNLEDTHSFLQSIQLIFTRHILSVTHRKGRFMHI